MNPAHAGYFYGMTGTKPLACLHCGGEKDADAYYCHECSRSIGHVRQRDKPPAYGTSDEKWSITGIPPGYTQEPLGDKEHKRKHT